MNENKPLTSKELRELLGYYYNNLPSDDEEMIKEARDTLLKFKRIHKDCIPKIKIQEILQDIYEVGKAYLTSDQADLIIKELKQRHLPTFENKRDIIAVKQKPQNP